MRWRMVECKHFNTERLKDISQISNALEDDAIRIRIGIGRDDIVGGPTVSTVSPVTLEWPVLRVSPERLVSDFRFRFGILS